MPDELSFPWDKLTPADTLECRLDVLLYGNTFAEPTGDGLYKRVDPRKLVESAKSSGWWTDAR